MKKQKSWADNDVEIKKVYNKQNNKGSLKSPDSCKLTYDVHAHIHTYHTCTYIHTRVYHKYVCMCSYVYGTAQFKLDICTCNSRVTQEICQDTCMLHISALKFDPTDK